MKKKCTNNNNIKGIILFNNVTHYDLFPEFQFAIVHFSCIRDGPRLQQRHPISNLNL